MALIEKKTSFFGRMSKRIEDVLLFRPTPDEDMLDELEEVLISSDIGMDTTVKIIDTLRDKIRSERLRTADAVRDEIKEIVCEMTDKGDRLKLSGHTPLIILMIGVNGAGKTTSIAKLAHMLKDQGKSVLLVAADTFRAAAADQLAVWCERAGAELVRQSEGSDPAAVVFDACSCAKRREADVLIVDTAGRLHNKVNLMNELAKIGRVIDSVPNAIAAIAWAPPSE